MPQIIIERVSDEDRNNSNNQDNARALDSDEGSNEDDFLNSDNPLNNYSNYALQSFYRHARLRRYYRFRDRRLRRLLNRHDSFGRFSDVFRRNMQADRNNTDPGNRDRGLLERIADLRRIRDSVNIFF